MVSGTTQNERRFSPRRYLHQRGERGFGVDVIDHVGLLGLEYAAGRGLAQRGFAAALDTGGLLALENVQAHDLALAVVKEQIQKIEMRDAVQAGAEIVKQFAEIAVMGDGFGDFEQRAGAGGERVFGGLCREVSHAAG